MIKKIISIVIFALLVYGGATFAVPPASKYSAGETLNPSCFPGSANCSVDMRESKFVDGTKGGSGLQPYLANINRARLKLNYTGDIEVNGGNFDPQTTFDVSSGITVNSVTINSNEKATINVTTGSSVRNGITITAQNGSLNHFGSTLSFDIANGPSVLSDILSKFQSSASIIASHIPPSRYLFADGTSGTCISDGGEDMYDCGNKLNTNFTTSIPYSNNSIISSPSFGSRGKYFTSKTNSIFLMVADLDNVSHFEITGNNGADGQGLTNTVVLTQGGYTAYIKRVYSEEDPSINHMIIVPNNRSTSRTAATNTDNDQHRVAGLNTGGVDRIYYLLFARSSGGYVDDTAMGNILTSFVNNVIN
jgi:hypothetical protein